MYFDESKKINIIIVFLIPIIMSPRYYDLKFELQNDRSYLIKKIMIMIT